MALKRYISIYIMDESNVLTHQQDGPRRVIGEDNGGRQ